MGEVVVQAMNEIKTHRHQCGRVVWGMLEGVGCGHIFEHEDVPGPPTVARHKCPQCGAAPWYHRLPEETPPARTAVVHYEDGFKMKVRSAV